MSTVMLAATSPHPEFTALGFRYAFNVCIVQHLVSVNDYRWG